MEKTYNVKRYDLGSYDRHFCLKAPFLLLASIAFLCRDFLLPLVVGLASIKGGNSNLSWLLSGGHQPFWYVIGFPALLVLYAAIRRVPAGDGVARLAWRHGQLLLTTSVILQIVSAALPFEEGGLRFSEDNLIPLLLLGTDICVLAYLVLSRRVADSFSDFPEREPASGLPKRRI